MFYIVYIKLLHFKLLLYLYVYLNLYRKIQFFFKWAFSVKALTEVGREYTYGIFDIFGGQNELSKMLLHISLTNYAHCSFVVCTSRPGGRD